MDPSWRETEPVALAEHFHHPDVSDVLPMYRHNQAAAIVGRYKMAVRGGEARLFDLLADPDERRPSDASVLDFASRLEEEGVPRRAMSEALDHLRRRHHVAAASRAPVELPVAAYESLQW